MITLLIPTRKRPAQLYPLLESIKKFGNGQFDVKVLYKVDDDYSKAYSIVAQSFPDVTFISETDFRANFIQILSEGQPNVSMVI